MLTLPWPISAIEDARTSSPAAAPWNDSETVVSVLLLGLPGAHDVGAPLALHDPGDVDADGVARDRFLRRGELLVLEVAGGWRERRHNGGREAVELLLVEREAVARAVERALERLAVLDRLLELPVADALGGLEQLPLVPRAQESAAPRRPPSPSRTAGWRRATCTSWQISAAFWTSSEKRTSGSGWFTPVTTAATSSPAAAARASSAGSIGGSNSGSCRKTPWMLRLLRILNSRSATVSQ